MRKRTKIVLGSVLVLVLSFFAVSQEVVRVPQLLNYQGYITDDQGQGLTGSYQVVFTLYNHPTNTSGHVKWTETRQVVVQQGHFAVLLGQVQPLHPNIFKDNPSLFIGVKIGTNPEMTPRYQIASVGYAHYSQRATYAYLADNATHALSAASLDEEIGDPDRYGKCPPDMLDMGCYCIDKDENGFMLWYDAVSFCQSENKRLCSYAEWYAACALGSPELNNITGDDEWIDEFNDDAQLPGLNPVRVGAVDCKSWGESVIDTTTNEFRCCK